MKVHQVRWQKFSGELEMHSLSCFKSAHNPCNELLGTYSNATFALTAVKENYTSLEKKKKGRKQRRKVWGKR